MREERGENVIMIPVGRMVVWCISRDETSTCSLYFTRFYQSCWIEGMIINHKTVQIAIVDLQEGGASSHRGRINTSHDESVAENEEVIPYLIFDLCYSSRPRVETRVYDYFETSKQFWVPLANWWRRGVCLTKKLVEPILRFEQFRNEYSREQIPIMKSRGTVWDMKQNYVLFNSNRTPGKPKDRMDRYFKTG